MNRVRLFNALALVLTICYARNVAAQTAGHPTSGAISLTVYVSFNTAGSTTCGIQEAIDSVPATGGTVMLPTGSCTVTSPITINKPVMVVGQGRGGYTVHSDNVWGATVIINGTTSDDLFNVTVPATNELDGVAFESFVVVGNRQVTGSTKGSDILLQGPNNRGWNLHMLSLRNVTLSNAHDCGLKIFGNAYMVGVTSSSELMNGGDGICVVASPDGQPGQIALFDNISDENGGNALTLSGPLTEDVNIFGGSYSDSQNGIYVDPNDSNAKVRCFGCHAEYNSFANINLSGGYDHVIDSCVLIGSNHTKYGIYLNNNPTTYVESSGRIRGCEINTNVTSDIFVGPNAKNAILESQAESNLVISDSGYNTQYQMYIHHQFGNGFYVVHGVLPMIGLSDDSPGVSTPNKYIESRLGNLYVYNSSLTSPILTLDDSGTETIPNVLDSGGLNLHGPLRNSAYFQRFRVDLIPTTSSTVGGWSDTPVTFGSSTTPESVPEPDTAYTVTCTIAAGGEVGNAQASLGILRESPAGFTVRTTNTAATVNSGMAECTVFHD